MLLALSNGLRYNLSYDSSLSSTLSLTFFSLLQVPADLMVPQDDPAYANDVFCARQFFDSELKQVVSTENSALKNAVNRTYAARYVARDNELRNETRRSLCLDKPHINMALGLKTALRRSYPLGVDRYGLQYWIFGAQGNFPITAFTDTCNQSHDYLDDPQILLRSPDGLWKVLYCADINTFIRKFDSTIPHERELRNNLIDKYFDTKRRNLLGPIKATMSRVEWIKRIKAIETWLTVPSPLSSTHRHTQNLSHTHSLVC